MREKVVVIIKDFNSVSQKFAQWRCFEYENEKNTKPAVVSEGAFMLENEIDFHINFQKNNACQE